MTNAYHIPDATLTTIDVLSDLEAMIMVGDVETSILVPYNTFNKLGGTPSPAMRQRVEEALEKLTMRQNVPAPNVGAPQPATVKNATTAQDHVGLQENVSNPSVDDLQSNAKSSTTSSTKTGPPLKVPAPPAGALKSSSSSTATTVYNQESRKLSKKAPTAEAKLVDHISIAKSILAVAVPVVTGAVELCKYIVAENRAEALRLQDMTLKKETILGKRLEKQDELQASMTKTYIEAGVKLTTHALTLYAKRA